MALQRTREVTIRRRHQQRTGVGLIWHGGSILVPSLTVGHAIMPSWGLAFARAPHGSALLEPALLEPQRRSVLGDRPDLRVVESVRRRRLDLDRHVQCHAGRRSERAEHLVGELLEVRGVAVGLEALATEEPRLAGGRR